MHRLPLPGFCTVTIFSDRIEALTDNPDAMTPATNDGWRPLHLTRDSALTGRDGRPLQRAVAASEMIRVRRGVAVDASGWAEMPDRDKYLLRMRAVAVTRAHSPVFSHHSAALLWGLPVIGRWPEEVHLSAQGRPGLHSKNGVVWHHDHLPDDDVVEIDGFWVTSLIRTLLDLARTSPFLSAVASIDYGIRPWLVLPSGEQLAGVPREELMERLAAEPSRRGSRAARVAIGFSNPLAGSPGESLSRGQIYLCGFPAPELQVRFVSPEGIEDIADLRWIQKQEGRTLKLLGEFDGQVKFTRDEYLQGRPPDQVLWAEKVREDRLRATTGHGMVRWVWDDALSRQRLRARLLEAGLRPMSTS